jgi:hypothetical protein
LGDNPREKDSAIHRPQRRVSRPPPMVDSVRPSCCRSKGLRPSTSGRTNMSRRTRERNEQPARGRSRMPHSLMRSSLGDGPATQERTAERSEASIRSRPQTPKRFEALAALTGTRGTSRIHAKHLAPTPPIHQPRAVRGARAPMRAPAPTGHPRARARLQRRLRSVKATLSPGPANDTGVQRRGEAPAAATAGWAARPPFSGDARGSAASYRCSLAISAIISG